MLLFALNLRMHLAFSFVLLFGALGSTLAEDCFSGNGAVTVLNPSCTGSTLLKVETAQLEVDFKWKGAYDSRKGQNLTFVLGGCLVNAKLRGTNRPHLDIKDDAYNLPLKLIAQPNKVSVVSSGDKISLNCKLYFEKIPNSSAFKINVTYTAPIEANLDGLIVNFHGSIYEVKPNNKIYTKVWFWIVIGGVCSLVIFGVIVIVVICCGKKESENWTWPSGRYSQKQLKQLISQFPPIEASNYQVHIQNAQKFIQNHPLNTEQRTALKNEEKIWYTKICIKDNDTERALNAYRTWFILNLIVNILGEQSEVSQP